MFQHQKAQVAGAIRSAILAAFDLDHEPVIETPPRRELGDLACPSPLHLAKTLRKPPRVIAEEIAAKLELPDGCLRTSIEGAGYLNVFFARSDYVARFIGQPDPMRREGSPAEGEDEVGKVIIEHTNINPNKAAHIGHLRNAVLGDTLARCHRALGRETEVQNYIDDTGVQVADVVVGFVDLEKRTVEDVRSASEPFDYLCWDVYSKAGSWFEEDSTRLELRRSTLHALESGEGDRAEMGRLVAHRIVTRHLLTMARLDVDYDVLTRESEILRLDFFSRAFEQLQESGAVRLEKDGKNEGCWVMPLSESAEFEGLEDPDKVIVRSDGTVTYVGKDIAYQLWKFGLLGRDFEYRRWQGFGEETSQRVWETAKGDDTDAPSFGQGDLVINVIDARQSYLQKIVRVGLEALGHSEEAEHSVHFAYEMVSLSENTARSLGYLDDDAEAGKSLEMSGRKGIGVKADDLLDQLEAKAGAEIAERNPDMAEADRRVLARQISVAALRYFMIKATTTRVIAFDLDRAMSFEGDSGPYLQYSLVRVKNIQRRLAAEGVMVDVSAETIGKCDDDLWSDDLWDLVLLSSQIGEVAERAASTLELSGLARVAAELAQRFHALYHRHPVLREEDESLRSVRLAAMVCFDRGLARVCDLMGVPVPEQM